MKNIFEIQIDVCSSNGIYLGSLVVEEIFTKKIFASEGVIDIGL